MRPLSQRFFHHSTVTLCHQLLGKVLFKVEKPISNLHKLPLATLLSLENLQIGIINETEAYDAHDPASHSFKGPTLRNKSMFAAAGTWYIYQIYGTYYCVNIVSQAENSGAAVLVRGIIPIYGLPLMLNRRLANVAKRKERENLEKIRLNLHRALGSPQHKQWQKSIHYLTGGPGKLAQALAIDKRYDGSSLLCAHASNVLTIRHSPQLRIPHKNIVRTPRIGITTPTTKQAMLRFTFTAATQRQLAARGAELLGIS